jgi:hypothetical protein
MNAACEKFFAGHPFINVDETTLRTRLVELIENADFRRAKAQSSREWVVKRHSLDHVMDELYGHYKAAGITLRPS